MLERATLTAVALAMLTLLTGCEPTMPSKPSYLDPAKRDQTPFECARDQNPCRIDVDPDAAEWVRENIRAKPNQPIRFMVKQGYAFAGSGIQFKSVVGQAAYTCGAGFERDDDWLSSARVVVCHPTQRFPDTTDSLDARQVKFGYTISVRGKAPYDPFVWPRD